MPGRMPTKKEGLFLRPPRTLSFRDVDKAGRNDDGGTTTNNILQPAGYFLSSVNFLLLFSEFDCIASIIQSFSFLFLSFTWFSPSYFFFFFFTFFTFISFYRPLHLPHHLYQFLLSYLSFFSLISKISNRPSPLHYYYY